MHLNRNRARAVTKWPKRLAVGFSAVLMCLYALLLVFPESNTFTEGPLTVVDINPLAPAGNNATILLALCSFVLGIVLLIRRYKVGWLPFVASLLCAPILFVSMIISDWATRSDDAKVVDANGVEYHMLGAGWLEGSWAIARLRSAMPLRHRFVVLVEGPQVSGNFLTLARPANFPKKPTLFLSGDGMLVEMDTEGACSVAYDPKTDLRYTSHSPANSKERPIASLSPFLLRRP